MIITAKNIRYFIVATPSICKINGIVSGLSALAEYTLLTRQDDRFDLAISLMQRFMPEHPATLFYGSSGRDVSLECAHDPLERVLIDGPRVLRAKAALILGGKHLDAGQHEEAERLHALGLRLTSPNTPLRVLLLKNLAVLHSIEGNHKAAIRILETIIGPAYHFRSFNSTIWLDCLNSLAEECRLLGHLRRASELIAMPMHSGLLYRYPQWGDTAKDITNQIKEQRIWIAGYRVPSLQSAAPKEGYAQNLVALIPNPKSEPIQGPGKVLRFKRKRRAYVLNLTERVIDDLSSGLSDNTILSILSMLHYEGVHLTSERPLISITRAIIRGEVKQATLSKIVKIIGQDYNTAR